MSSSVTEPPHGPVPPPRRQWEPPSPQFLPEAYAAERISHTAVPSSLISPADANSPSHLWYEPSMSTTSAHSASGPSLAGTTRGARDVAPDTATSRQRLRISNPFLQSLLDRRPTDAAHAPPFLQFLSPMVRYSKLPFRLLCRRFGADLAFTPMIIAKDINRGSFATDLPPSISAEYAAACKRLEEEKARAQAAEAAADQGLQTGAGERVGSAPAAASAGEVMRMPILTPSSSDPFSSRVTIEEFSTFPLDRPLIAQLAAHDPVELSRCAAAFAGLVDGVDINCGCPQSWIIKEKCGAALSAQPQLVGELVKAVRSTLPAGMTVSVKVRLRPDLRETIDLVRRAAAAGADWVTVHGRTRDEGTTPAVRAEAIALLRSAVDIPVIFNGDVTTPSGAAEAVAATGAAGVLVARGALANPAMFAGLDSPPAAVVADYTTIALRYGGPWAGHLHHASYALYTPCARARRAVLARGKGLAVLVDAGAVGGAGGAGVDGGVPGGWGGAWGQWGDCGAGEQQGLQQQSGRGVVSVPGEHGLWGWESEPWTGVPSAQAEGEGGRVPLYSHSSGAAAAASAAYHRSRGRIEGRYAPEYSPSEAKMQKWRPILQLGRGGSALVGADGDEDDELEEEEDEDRPRLWGDVEERASAASLRAYAVPPAVNKWPGVAVPEEDDLWDAIDARCGRDPAPGVCRATDHDPRTRYWL